jgi:multidrug resistance efflux pump
MNDANEPTGVAPRADGPAGLNGPNVLSDRVRSLRLPERRSGGRGGCLPWGLCVLFFLSSVALGAMAFRPGTGSAGPPGAVPAVSGDVAGSGDVVLEAKGYVIPAHTIQVSPEVAGRIEWLHPDFEEGRHFEPWMVLARLKSVEYRAELDRARGVLAAAQERLQEIETGWPLERQQAEAKLASARSNMEYRQRELDRVRRGGVSSTPKERDEAESLAEQAVKAHDEALKAVELLGDKGPRPSRIAAARAEVKQAEADLVKAQERADNCYISPPVAGTILTKKAEKGNMVNPVAFNISASLCDMADLRDLEVDLSIQERDIAQVFVGQDCAVMPEAFQKCEPFLQKHPGGYKGVVSRLMPIADRAKGAIPVRVKIDRDQIPPEEEGAYLKPDMGVIVSFKKAK